MQTDIQGRIFAQLSTFVISTFRRPRKVGIALIAEESPTTLMTLADVVIFQLPAPCFRVSPDTRRRPKGRSCLHLVREGVS